MPVIYIKLRAIFQQNGGRIGFFFYSNGISISYLDSFAWFNLILTELLLLNTLYAQKWGIIQYRSAILDF